MNSRSPLLRLLATLCVLAQFGAQVNGAILGYLCDCGGEQVWTATTHCHGPHGSDCHSDTDYGTTHPEENDGDREDHAVVRADESARPVAAVVAPFINELLLVVLPSLIIPVCDCDAATLALIEGDSPPAAITIARTVSLRI